MSQRQRQMVDGRNRLATFVVGVVAVLVVGSMVAHAVHSYITLPTVLVGFPSGNIKGCEDYMTNPMSCDIAMAGKYSYRPVSDELKWSLEKK